MKLFLHKLFHWEYWPFHALYFPVFFQWAYYSIRAKTIFFYNASNPGIKNGGFLAESKKEIYDLLPPQYYPKTILVKAGSAFDEVLPMLESSGIVYPLIAKPDIGLRGSAVVKINTEERLKTYHQNADFDYLIQDVIPFENEIGIFYVRYPSEEKGKITGIVAKEFLIVTGDGHATIETLIRKTPRYEMQLKNLQREYGSRLSKVLEKGEKLNLVPFGNHVRGAKFLDATDKASPKLTTLMNNICIQIPGFYFGRLDILYNTFEELEEGRNFLIVEVNGAASEPTHIYDPKHSVFFAWKELLRHTKYMYEISMENHRNGFPLQEHKAGMEQYRIHLAQNKKIMNFS